MRLVLEYLIAYSILDFSIRQGTLKPKMREVFSSNSTQKPVSFFIFEKNKTILRLYLNQNLNFFQIL